MAGVACRLTLEAPRFLTSAGVSDPDVSGGRGLELRPGGGQADGAPPAPAHRDDGPFRHVQPYALRLSHASLSGSDQVV